MICAAWRCFATTVVFAVLLAAQPATQPLNNDGVIKLSRAGMNEEVILAAVKSASAVHFDTSPDGLLALKQAGITDRVLLAILERQRAAPSAPPEKAPGKVILLAGEKEVELTSSPVLLAYGPKDTKFSEKVKQTGVRLDADYDHDKAATDASRPSGLGRTLKRLPVNVVGRWRRCDAPTVGRPGRSAKPARP